MNRAEAKIKLYGIANELSSRAPLSNSDVCAQLIEIANAIGDGVSDGAVQSVPDRTGVVEWRAPFCVIGRSVVLDRMIDRTWRETKPDAEAHASNLLDKPYGNSKPIPELLVVRVVSVVRRKRNHEVLDIAGA